LNEILTEQAFIPTILLSSLIPTISGILTQVATKLNEYENYETQEAYDAAFIQKILVLNFITSYLPILLTAFVYVPFANDIVPHLDIFRVTVHPFVAEEDQKMIHPNEFKIDPSRLRKQVIYFTVTAQIVNFAMETIVPFVKINMFRKYKEISTEHLHKRSDTKSNEMSTKRSPTFSDTDSPEEKRFLQYVRQQAELTDYDVSDDLREMVIQFGYLSLFSPVWPLIPVSFLINNWVELRSDFFKICKEFRRPTPERADTIGPWLNTLSLLSWVGSITSSSLIYMFYDDITPDPDVHHSGYSSSDHRKINGWVLFVTIFIAEHAFLGIRSFIELTMKKVETPSMRQERAQQYLLRKTMIGDEPHSSSLALSPSFQDDTTTTLEEPQSHATRETLEGDAKESTLREAHPSNRFWKQQQNWRDAAAIGKGIIEERTREKEEEKNKKTQ
jgi:anoctamin-10